MTFETIVTQQDGAAFIITLNRPTMRNAINVQMTKEVMAACKIAESSPSVRAVIVTGGPDYFSAGGDLNEALALKTMPEIVSFMKHYDTAFSAIETLDKPVIAAIEGFCITGGWEFAMACDIRVAGEGATFTLTGARIGTVPGGGGTQRLPRQVGVGKALDIHFSAEPISAAEAYRIGAVERLVAKGEAMTEAKAMVKVYEKRAPLSHAYAKRAVRAGVQMDMVSALEYERFLVTAVYETQDRKEGIAAFLEKRPAVFTGR